MCPFVLQHAGDAVQHGKRLYGAGGLGSAHVCDFPTEHFTDISRLFPSHDIVTADEHGRLDAVEVWTDHPGAADAVEGFDEMSVWRSLLQMFGFDTDILASKRGTLLVDPERDDNQGYKLEYIDNGASVLLETYLGDFRDNAGLIVPNEGITRRMSVSTPTTIFEILFDPAEGVPRYHARIREINLEGIVSEKVIVDNHLKKHLSYFRNDESLQGINNFACIENGMKITEALFGLRENAETVLLPSVNSAAGRLSGDNVGSLK